jgi:hypothetical protein
MFRTEIFAEQLSYNSLESDNAMYLHWLLMAGILPAWPTRIYTKTVETEALAHYITSTHLERYVEVCTVRDASALDTFFGTETESSNNNKSIEHCLDDVTPRVHRQQLPRLVICIGLSTFRVASYYGTILHRESVLWLIGDKAFSMKAFPMRHIIQHTFETVEQIMCSTQQSKTYMTTVLHQNHTLNNTIQVLPLPICRLENEEDDAFFKRFVKSREYLSQLHCDWKPVSVRAKLQTTLHATQVEQLPNITPVSFSLAEIPSETVIDLLRQSQVLKSSAFHLSSLASFVEIFSYIIWKAIRPVVALETTASLLFEDTKKTSEPKRGLCQTLTFLLGHGTQLTFFLPSVRIPQVPEDAICSKILSRLRNNDKQHAFDCSTVPYLERNQVADIVVSTAAAAAARDLSSSSTTLSWSTNGRRETVHRNPHEHHIYFGGSGLTSWMMPEEVMEKLFKVFFMPATHVKKKG